jgi:hypothetical protein
VGAGRAKLEKNKWNWQSWEPDLEEDQCKDRRLWVWTLRARCRGGLGSKGCWVFFVP